MRNSLERMASNERKDKLVSKGSHEKKIQTEVKNNSTLKTQRHHQ